MIKVETVKAHSNGYGDKPEKAIGDVYELPEGHALQLIASKLVKRPTDAKPA